MARITCRAASNLLQRRQCDCTQHRRPIAGPTLRLRCVIGGLCIHDGRTQLSRHGPGELSHSLIEVQIKLSIRKAVSLPLPLNPYRTQYMEPQLRRRANLGIEIAALQDFTAQASRDEPERVGDVDVL